jgi:hypothetical protein
MDTCVFCERPAFTGGWVKPEMCEPHFELAVIRAHLSRENRRFTVGNVLATARAKEGEGVRFSFTHDQVPELVAQMLVDDLVYIPALSVPALV